MAATFTFGAAMTLRAGGHIRVTLVLAGSRRPRVACWRSPAALVATLSSASLPSPWSRSPGALRAGQTSISSETPLWIPQAVVTFGMVLLALQFLARFFQALLGLPLEDHRMKAGAGANRCRTLQMLIVVVTCS